MSLIHTSARFGPIDPADLSEFKEVAASLLESTNAEDGTLRYDWFFSDDGTWCEIREIYADSDAVFVHIANSADRLGRLNELGGGLTLQVYGDPTPELREALASFGGPAIFSTYQTKQTA